MTWLNPVPRSSPPGPATGVAAMANSAAAARYTVPGADAASAAAREIGPATPAASAALATASAMPVPNQPRYAGSQWCASGRSIQPAAHAAVNSGLAAIHSAMTMTCRRRTVCGPAPTTPRDTSQASTGRAR